VKAKQTSFPIYIASSRNYARILGVVWLTKCNVNDNGNDLHSHTQVPMVTSLNRPVLVSSVVSDYG
jgi:hypothetical protein